MAYSLSHRNDTLHRAVERDDEEAVKRLLEQCPDLEAMDESGKTALHLACTNLSHRIVEILLNSGASVHTANGSYGGTALHEAVIRGTADAVALLLQRGADVRATDQYRFTALHHAARTSSESKIKLLLVNGADIEAQSNNGFTPLATAISWGKIRAAELLISRGANVHWASIYWRNNTLLHIAAKRNNTRALQLLLDSKLDVDTVVGGDSTALLAVAWRPQCLYAVEWLLNNGARINYQHSVKGFTALHCAVDGKATSTVQLLLEYGADLNVEDKKGFTPVGMAVNLSRSKMMYPAFAKQLAMMKAQNLFVSEKNLQTISEDDELKSCSASCFAEIEKMLKFRIGDSNVKLFDVLSKGENKLARYAANEMLKQGLEDGNYENEFPIYANVIRKKVLQGRERRNLLRQSSESLFRVINEFYQLPEDCVEMINRCLTNADLAVQIR